MEGMIDVANGSLEEEAAALVQDRPGLYTQEYGKILKWDRIPGLDWVKRCQNVLGALQRKKQVWTVVVGNEVRWFPGQEEEPAMPAIPTSYLPRANTNRRRLLNAVVRLPDYDAKYYNGMLGIAYAGTELGRLVREGFVIKHPEDRHMYRGYRVRVSSRIYDYVAELKRQDAAEAAGAANRARPPGQPQLELVPDQRQAIVDAALALEVAGHVRVGTDEYILIQPSQWYALQELLTGDTNDS